MNDKPIKAAYVLSDSGKKIYSVEYIYSGQNCSCKEIPSEGFDTFVKFDNPVLFEKLSLYIDELEQKGYVKNIE